MIHLYYYSPLPLHYDSAQTIQVIQDYSSLSAHNYRLFLFGSTRHQNELKTIQNQLASSQGTLLHAKGNRSLLRLRFLSKIITDPNPKVIIARNSNKIEELIRLRFLFRKARIFLERHEDAVPYLVNNWPTSRVKKEKKRWEKILQKVDGMILTSQPQEDLFKQEFLKLPPTIILPNGVDIRTFSQASSPEENPEKFILTYTGQFTAWKNVELVFAACAKLDKRYCLRIAGGKLNDTSSREYVQRLTKQYGLSSERVDFRGFVPREKLVDEVLTGSSALLLPLGDNPESRAFTSPMKLFEYMATPIPTVAVGYPTITSIAGEESLFLSQNNPVAFAEAIKLATQDRDESQRRVKQMNKSCLQYSYEQRSEKLNRFIRSCRS